jgi:hypothetical protein
MTIYYFFVLRENPLYLLETSISLDGIICWKKTSYMMHSLEQSIVYVGKKFRQIDRDPLRHATYMTEQF